MTWQVKIEFSAFQINKATMLFGSESQENATDLNFSGPFNVMVVGV